MFRAGTTPLLGRWSSRDFLRGRSKKGGAIHTRHTHGSKGRYKRLSTLYGLRDGRRHAANHMQGGLGLKLGGGLFGLRIPRQHMLSTMSREEYELEMYGHPNITNPYREHMEEHPDLRAVMQNAALTTHMIVLLPRASRATSLSPPERSAETLCTPLPPQWASTAALISTASEVLLPFRPSSSITTMTELHVHLATLEVSACVQLSGADGGTEEALRHLLAGVYAEHSKGRRLCLSEAGAPLKSEARRVPFMGDALRAPPPLTQQQQPLASTTQSSRGVTRDVVGARAKRESDARSAHPVGVQTLIHEIRRDNPNALCVCLRPTTLSDTRASPSTEEDATRGSHHDHHRSTGAGSAGRSARERLEAQTPTRPLLKADVNWDEEYGVWGKPRGSLEGLVRWHYSNSDPRAHSSDALPHCMREMSVVLLVDCSKLAPSTAPNSVAAPTRVQSLVSRQFAVDLERMGFKAVRPTTLNAALNTLGHWSAGYSWSRFTQGKLGRGAVNCTVPVPASDAVSVKAAA